METFAILATLAVVHLLAAASPGPNLVVVAAAAHGSRRAGLLTVAGILLAVTTWLAMATLGLGIVLARYPLVYAVLQYVGAGYLVWLGLRLLYGAVADRYRRLDPAAVGDRPAGALVRRGYLVNMSNPKTIGYYTSLFVVLIPPGSPAWLFLAASAVALAVSMSWWLVVVLLFSTGTVRGLFARSRRIVDLLMGGTLVLIGLRLAVSR